ncbi:glycosyltransferase [Patescibacteria group bacterium]
MLVSVIVPIYNQEKTIRKDLKNIYDVMKKTRWDFEIIGVVDGSPDNSLKEAKKFKRKKVKIIGYKKNHGKGYAVRYGMARAKGDLIAFVDSGMDINPNSISMLLEHREWYDSDITVGSKRHSASKVNFSLMRKIYSIGYYYGVRILFGLRIRDTQVGLKVFKREVLEEVLPRLLVKEFAFDIELLAVAHRLGYTKIDESPVELTLDFDPNSKWSKYRPLFLDPNVIGMLIDTLAIYYRLKILKYYDDHNKRKWRYSEELDMRINTGAMK